MTPRIDNPSFKPVPNLEGDMSKWVQSYLEMENLLLNKIHFQRAGK